MKKYILFFTVLILSFGLLFVGCDNGSTNTGDDGGSLVFPAEIRGTWECTTGGGNTYTVIITANTLTEESAISWWILVEILGPDYYDMKMNNAPGYSSFKATINGSGQMVVTNAGSFHGGFPNGTYDKVP